MGTVYDSLFEVALRVSEEQDKVGLLLKAAELKLHELNLDIEVQVPITKGQKLLHRGGKVYVVYYAENTLPEARHWVDCSPSTQVNAVCCIKQLLEAMEEQAKKLLSDLEAVQDIAYELGIGFKAPPEESEPKPEVVVETQIALPIAPPEEPEKPKEPEESPEEIPVKAAPSNGKNSSSVLKPFYRYNEPKGPVPDEDDQKGQKEYCRKLLLWYYTNSSVKFPYLSLKEMVDKKGIKPSRLYNAKNFVKSNFPYIFRAEDGLPYAHHLFPQALGNNFNVVDVDISTVNVSK